MPRNFGAAVFLTLSFIGLVLAAAIANSSRLTQDRVIWRKPLVGGAFSVLCVLGVLAGVFPSICSGIVHFRRPESERLAHESTGFKEKTIALHGHHPDCGYFRAHVFRVGDKVLCAGCTGLISGALLSLFGTIIYFLLDVSFSTDYTVVFWVGFLGVSCGLLQYQLFNWGRSSVHLLVNAFFVFGVFLLLVAVDATTNNTIIGLYLVTLSIFWLYTRILLSRIDHRKICAACTVEACELCKDSAS
jgi:hypothetical protein